MNEDLMPVVHEVGNIEPNLAFYHHFLGFGTHHSTVSVKIWHLNGGKAFVLFTDIGKGTSVTNAAEQLIEEVYFKKLGFKYSKENVFFAETYEGKKEAVDFVLPQWEGDKVIDVSWKHIGTLI